MGRFMVLRQPDICSSSLNAQGQIEQMREYAGFMNRAGDLSDVGDVSSGRDVFDYRNE